MDCPSSLGLLKFQDWYKNCYSNLQVTAIKKGVGWGERINIHRYLFREDCQMGCSLPQCIK